MWNSAEECDVYEPPAQARKGNSVAETRPRLGLIPFSGIRPGEEPPYLVKGLIPREGLTVVWGEPKSGKSFQSFDLAMAVARGIDYRGRRVQEGPVVYCAAEGATGFRNRVEAYRQHHELDGALPFYLVPDALNLVDDATELVTSIRATLGETKPLLVVLDTLNRSLAGNENDPGDMAAYIKAALTEFGRFVKSDTRTLKRQNWPQKADIRRPLCPRKRT